MSEYFPNSIVLPTFGNNDTKYHYLPAFGEYAPEYYAGFYNSFFKMHPRNSQLPEIDEVNRTMSKSGYYRVQIAPNLHILSLNTLYFNSLDTYEDTSPEIEQLRWIES